MSRTIAEVRETLQEIKDDTEQSVFEFKDLRYESTHEGGKLWIAGEESHLFDSSFRSLCEVLEVPVPYAKRIPEELLEHTVNYFIDQKGNDGQVYSVLKFRGGVRAFVNPTYPYVPMVDVFNRIIDVVGEDSELKYVTLDANKAEVTILPHDHIEPIDDSNVYGGLRMVYSDSWSVFPRFDAFLWRELCSNGMIEPVTGRKFRVSGGTSEAVLSQVEDFARISLDKLPEMIESFRALLGETVEDWVSVLNKICVEYKIPNKVRTRLHFWAAQPEFLYTVSNEKIENMHDIVNLITYTGTHDTEISEDNKVDLLEIAADITNSHKHRCGSCGSSVED